MYQIPEPDPVKIAPKPLGYSAAASLVKGLLAVVVLLGMIFVGMDVSGRIMILPFFPHGDHLTNTQIQERLTAFNALSPLPLSVVSEVDTPQGP